MSQKKLQNVISVPAQIIERRIYMIRGEKVMIDSDLAELYQVLTKNLNLAVRRNKSRFPMDFMFQLTRKEVESMRLQIGTASKRNVRFMPYVFTEHGVAMLSSILHSKRAVQMNILIIRAFVKLREIFANNKELAHRIEKMEDNQKKHASVINLLADEIDKLKIPSPIKPKEQIGFTSK